MTDLVTAFGKAVRNARGRRGVSQHELATTAGLSTRTVSAIERGAHDPLLTQMYYIAGALGLTLRELTRLAEDLRRTRAA
jgi:transcriptional regulator with XRE-family HTH domain